MNKKREREIEILQSLLEWVKDAKRQNTPAYLCWFLLPSYRQDYENRFLKNYIKVSETEGKHILNKLHKIAQEIVYEKPIFVNISELFNRIWKQYELTAITKQWFIGDNYSARIELIKKRLKQLEAGVRQNGD